MAFLTFVLGALAIFQIEAFGHWRWVLGIVFIALGAACFFVPMLLRVWVTGPLCEFDLEERPLPRDGCPDAVGLVLNVTNRIRKAAFGANIVILPHDQRFQPFGCNGHARPALWEKRDRTIDLFSGEMTYLVVAQLSPSEGRLMIAYRNSNLDHASTDAALPFEEPCSVQIELFRDPPFPDETRLLVEMAPSNGRFHARLVGTPKPYNLWRRWAGAISGTA